MGVSPMFSGGFVSDLQSKPDILEYAAPEQPPPARLKPVASCAVGCLAVLIGVFSISLLSLGVRGLDYALHHRNEVLFDQDLAEATVATVGGSFCLLMSIRWIRNAMR